MVGGWFVGSRIEVWGRKVGGIGEVEEMKEMSVGEGVGEGEDGVWLWRGWVEGIGIESEMRGIRRFGREGREGIVIRCEEMVIG